MPVIILGLALVYAPLAFGCTTPATRWVLDGLLAACGILHLGARLMERRRPAIPAGVLWILGLLMLQAVVMIANPIYSWDHQSWQFIPAESATGYLPGTLDWSNSWPVVVHFLAMSLAFLCVIDLSKDPKNRWTFLRVISLTGLLIAVIGIFQKATFADSMLWIDTVYEERTFFAAFRYHANATSFLNLCWPASLVLFLRSFHVRESHLLRAIWGNAFLFTFAALFINSSKYGHVVAIPSLVIAGLVFKKSLPSLRGLSKMNLVVGATVALVAVVVLALLSLELSAGKWQQLVQFEGDNSLDRRLLTQGVCLKMAMEAGPFGFGPGTFHLVFPFYTHPLGERLAGYWIHAHQDYLETLIDWGYIGGSLWIGLFVWGVIRGLRGRFRPAPELSREAALVALILVGLHALVDFPLQIGALQLISMIYLGMLFARSQDKRPRRKWRRRRKPGKFGRGGGEIGEDDMPETA